MPPIDPAYESISDDGLSAAGNSERDGSDDDIGDIEPTLSPSSMEQNDEPGRGHDAHHQTNQKQDKDQVITACSQLTKRQNAEGSDAHTDSQQATIVRDDHKQRQQSNFVHNSDRFEQKPQIYDETTDGSVRYRAFMAAIRALPPITSEPTYEPATLTPDESTTASATLTTAKAAVLAPSRMTAFMNSLCDAATRFVRWWVGEVDLDLIDIANDNDSERSFFVGSPQWFTFDEPRVIDGPGPEFVDRRFLWVPDDSERQREPEDAKTTPDPLRDE